MKKNTKKRVIFYALVLFVVLWVVFAQRFSVRTHTLTLTDCLDTVCDISVVSRTDKPLKQCQEYLEFADIEFSATDENATLYKLNNDKTTEISDDLKELIEYGKDFSDKHPELFSIYLNPLVEAWDIKNNSGTIPDVAVAMSKVQKKTSVNLGGIAKGYITSRLTDILRKNGIDSALINLGGNAYAMGKKQTGENWKVGICDPKNESDIIGIITAQDIAVITSGDYQRYFEANGVRYHHIFDPITGYPAKSGLRSVTVISDDPTLADALSTAAFVAGVDKGNELLKQYNAGGIFITDDTVYFSKSIENIFKQTNFSYKYEFLY